MDATAFHFDARIDPLADSSIHPSSWFITFGLGGPARSMFTEVLIRDSRKTIETATLGEIVRAVASKLYGREWAFFYPPDDYDAVVQPLFGSSLTRRERVVVSGIEVWS